MLGEQSLIVLAAVGRLGSFGTLVLRDEILEYRLGRNLWGRGLLAMITGQ